MEAGRWKMGDDGTRKWEVGIRSAENKSKGQSVKKSGGKLCGWEGEERTGRWEVKG